MYTEDLEIWLRLKQGDEEAFAALFEKYHATLYNYGRKIAPANPALVEDAVQDLFIDLWRLRGGLTDNVQSIRYYLYRSLRRRLANIPKATELPSEITEAEESPENTMMSGETDKILSEVLKKLIRELPVRQQEALTLRYYEGFSISEVATIMQVNEKSVRNFLYKALVQLRRSQSLLVKYGIRLTVLVSISEQLFFS